MPVFPLPFSRFTVTTRLTPSEVEGRLRSHIVPAVSIAERSSFGIEAMFRRLEGQPTPTWFEGTLKDGQFTLHLLVSTYNSFIPYLFGSIVAGSTGTEVRVFTRPHWFATIFTLAWLGVVAGIAGGVPISVREAPVVLLMLLFGVALYFGVFMVGATKARRLLEQLLGAGAAPPAGAT